MSDKINAPELIVMFDPSISTEHAAAIFDELRRQRDACRIRGEPVVLTVPDGVHIMAVPDDATISRVRR